MSPSDAARPAPTGEPQVDAEYVDELTGLHNRRFLYPFVQKHLAGQPGAGPLSLLLLDIDHFRSVNEAHGTDVGDSLIRHVAERIRLATPRKGRAVRLAGDRFVVVLPGRKADNAKAAERLIGSVSGRPHTLPQLDAPLALVLSGGLVEAPTDGESLRGLIAAMNRALRLAREGGGGRVGVAGDLPPDRPPVQDLLEGFPCPDFVGRSLEVARCESLSHLGERGPTTLVIVRGDGGVGKTRLLREMARRRRDAGDLVLWARCREELRTSPYAAVNDVLAAVFGKHPAAARALSGFLGDDDLGVLAQRVQAARSDGPSPERTPDGQWRSRFFSVTLSALRFLGREHSLCLLLDDLQYADAASLKVLTFLLRHDRQDRAGAGIPMFASVATDTRESVDEATAFAHFQRFTRGWPTVGTVELGPLPAPAVRAMIDGCFDGHHFPPELATRVHQVTGGNALFVEEVLIVLAVSGFIVKDGRSWRLERRSRLTLPGNLGELVSERLRALDAETSDALMKASVMGSQFSISLLKRVLGVNEGHAAQLTDRAMDFRFLDGSDPADLDAVRFANRRLRQLTYQIVGDDVRRDVHRQVAALKENFEVVDLDEALAEIAWHHERDGDPSRTKKSRARQREAARKVFRSEEAQDYVEVAAKVVAPRIETAIPEATVPLGEHAAAHLPKLMKGLATVHRGVQMYPPGSQYVRRSVDGCLRELRVVLRDLESLTLKERGGALEINNQPDDEGNASWGSVAEDMVRTFRRAQIHSVTFTRSCTPADLESLGQGMTHFAQLAAKGSAVGERWQQFLAQRGCRGVGVVPKQFRATAAGEAELLAGSRLEGLARESARHLPLLKDILRYTAGTSEAIQLYPKGSKTVARALEGLVTALRQAHTSGLRSINLGATNDGFLVNDLRLDARTFGDSVTAMHQLFGRTGVRSLSFEPAVRAGDLERLFRLLSAPAEADTPQEWPVRLEAAGIRHIGVDEYVFVAADALGGASEAGARPTERAIRVDRQTFMLKVMEGPPGGLLDPQIRPALAHVLTELVLDGEAEQSERIVGRLFENLDAPDPPLRVTTLEVFAELLGETSSVVARRLKEQCTAHLSEALREERNPAPLSRLIDLSAEVADHQLRAGELREASRILWQLGKGFQADAHVHEGCRRQSAEVVKRLMQTDAFERALASLWTPNEKRRALALHLLESCGRHAVTHLLQLAIDAPEDRARRIHAEQLSAMGAADALTDKLAAMITPYATAQRTMHVLELIEQLGCDPVAALTRAFQHPHSGVLDAAAALIRRLPPEVAERALGRLGRFEDPRLRASVVALVGEIVPPNATRQLVEMLRDPATTPALQVEIVHALGRTGDARVVDDLVEVLATSWWRRLLGRDTPTELRVAAIWSLGALDDDRARDAVRDALHDPDPRVRTAADAQLPEELD